MRVMFLFSKKKNIFLWKNIFSHLHYSMALPESSPFMRIVNFYENHDFHWFLSKIMKIDGFRCSWTSPASGVRSETVCVAFLNRWEKYFFSWKNIFLHFALLYGYAQSRARSSKSSIFMKKHGFHWFSLILVKNQWKSLKINENQWKSWFFMKIDDFHDRARLWQSRRVVQNAKKYFFIKNCFFFLGNKNTAHIVSDIVPGMGAL